MASPAPSTGSAAGKSTNQETLINWCRTNNQRLPNWQIISDRRGKFRPRATVALGSLHCYCTPEHRLTVRRSKEVAQRGAASSSSRASITQRASGVSNAIICAPADALEATEGDQWHVNNPADDGNYVNNAREDAAERALQAFGVLPPPPVPTQMQHLQHSQQPAAQKQQPPRKNYYGAIGS